MTVPNSPRTGLYAFRQGLFTPRDITTGTAAEVVRVFGTDNIRVAARTTVTR